MVIEGVFYIEAKVSDLARSKRFYGETLGWKQGTDIPGVLSAWHFGAGYFIAQQDHRPEGERSYAGGMFVEVKVTDIEAEHARLKGLGVAVEPLKKQPWGETNFGFTDPDGYRWQYGQG